MPRAKLRIALFACVPCGLACGSGTEDAVTLAASPDRWTQIDPIADPLASHQPANIDCGIGGWTVERNGFEIRTTACNYAAFAQGTLVAIPAGAHLTTHLVHYDLTASEPAMAHVALMIAGTIVWERWIPVPSAADLHEITIPVGQDIPANAPILFHLHNHGQNSWLLAPIAVRN